MPSALAKPRLDLFQRGRYVVNSKADVFGTHYQCGRPSVGQQCRVSTTHDFLQCFMPLLQTLQQADVVIRRQAMKTANDQPDLLDQLEMERA